MECPICFNIIENSAIGSCTHHFCLKCIVKWCQFGGTKCPTCKTFISEIRQDREFDQINNPSGNHSYTIPNQITINFPNKSCIGITLRNNYNWFGLGSRGPGVVIKKLSKNSMCYKEGLRAGDIIIFINNIPCIDHNQVIQIINRCAFINNSISCTLLCVNKAVQIRN